MLRAAVVGVGVKCREFVIGFAGARSDRGLFAGWGLRGYGGR